MGESDEAVDLHDLVQQWGQEFALEQQLADIEAGEPEPEPTWVSLGEAEQAVGVSRSTLRAWYRGGQIPSRLTPSPHGLQRLVPLEAVISRAARSPRTGPRGSPSPPAEKEPPVAPGLSTPDAMVRLAELAASAAAERAERAEARAAEAEASLHAALERAAAAEAEIRLLRGVR